MLAREHLEILSGWDARATRLDPAKVDWRAAAAGRTELRMRQLPGPDNMMGRIKFMLPNPLGIYLHDTPNKAVFGAADRRRSSGCVRLEDAPRLARRLFGGTAPAPNGTPEQRADLPRPVPVYILYLTASPADGAVAMQPDAYRRDPAVERAIS